MWCVTYMHFLNKMQWCWFFLAPLLWATSSSPSFFSFNIGFYTLAPINYNTFCPKTYVIRAYSIINIYAIKDGFIDISVTSGLCHSTMPHNITSGLCHSTMPHNITSGLCHSLGLGSVITTYVTKESYVINHYAMKAYVIKESYFINHYVVKAYVTH